MEIRLLECFLTIAEEQNVTRAANILHISQPALSRQLSQLETELGCELFVRGKRKMELTDKGLLLKRRAKEIMSLVSITENEIAHSDENVEGCVGIGAGELSASDELADLVGMFSQTYAHVTFELFSGTADQVMDRIDNGLLDLGLFVEPVDKKKFDYLPMGEGEKYVACMTPHDPLARQQFVTPADLESRTIMLPSRAGVRSVLAHWMGDIYETLDVRFSDTIGVNSMLLVKKGYTIALASQGHVENLDPARFAYRPLRPAVTGGVVLAWKRDVPHNAATQAFISYLKGKKERPDAN